MFGNDLVIRTRLTPPRLPLGWLRRTRLEQLLAGSADHALTVVYASAGYGKSCALAELAAHGGWPVIWYSVAEATRDPLVFLLHLVHACRRVAPDVGKRAIAFLEGNQHPPHAWTQALDTLLNELAQALDDETLIVLDDYHALDNFPQMAELVERLITQRPPQLHVILATRHWPQLQCLAPLQVRGELLVVAERDLAFTDDETATLFGDVYERELNAEERKAIGKQTEGWPIALQLIWQGVRDQWDAEGPTPLSRVIESERAAELHGDMIGLPQPALFRYLAQEVLARQSGEIQHFLLRSSVLTELDPQACDRILGIGTAAETLQFLYRHGLFVIRLNNDLYRYHPLFHAFLQHQARLTLADWSELHRGAAAFYREQQSVDNVLYHLHIVGDITAIGAELERWAQPWIERGRFVTLLHWLDQLPVGILQGLPHLLIARGDAARFCDRFDLAQSSYAAAHELYRARGDVLGEARALQGHALIYLDTVQPAQARTLLRQAWTLVPRTERRMRAALARLLAENRLNEGRADQAARLYRLADRIFPPASGGAGNVQPRVLLRLGKLHEAQEILERQLGREHEGTQRHPEAHREVTILLSLVGALNGKPEDALRYARQGLAIAQTLGSGMVEATAHIRLGHALQIISVPDLPAANAHYLQAIALADTFRVQRTKAEAYLGLTLLHGFGEDFLAAQAAAGLGLDIIKHSGDTWTEALLSTALGAAGVVHGVDDAPAWLTRALDLYRRSHDTYGEAVAHLWLAVWQHQNEQPQRAAEHAIALLHLMQRHQYESLITEPTLFGPRDRMMLVPILLAGRANVQLHTFAQNLLGHSFPAIAVETTQPYHPGATLRIRMFGPLRIWRGRDEVAPNEWQRKKAAQLLALLLAHRQRWLHREQICAWLWPDQPLEVAATQLKVTFNALNVVLEPMRPPRTPATYIQRRGQSYRFTVAAGVWLDVDAFEAQIAGAKALLARGTPDDRAAAQSALMAAVELYGGDYLSDWLYEDWTQDERDRLTHRYLQAAAMLAELLMNSGELEAAERLCEMMLAHDPCWEDAYMLLMRVYMRLGNRRLAVATYERCVRNLRNQLDVTPSPEAVQLYEELRV